MTTPAPEYPIGSVKQNTETKAVAVCTGRGGAWAWGVMTIDNGGHHGPDSEVADWPDLMPPATT